MTLFQVEFWDQKGRVWRAVQLSPGAAPPSLDRAEADEFATLVATVTESNTRILPAPKGAVQTRLADLRERFSNA